MVAVAFGKVVTGWSKIGTHHHQELKQNGPAARVPCEALSSEQIRPAAMPCRAPSAISGIFCRERLAGMLDSRRVNDAWPVGQTQVCLLRQYWSSQGHAASLSTGTRAQITARSQRRQR